MDDYLMEFATLLKEADTYRFELDNGRLLFPENTDNIKGENGQRVILNYTPLNGDSIKVNHTSTIYTGLIEQGSYPDKYVDDPVKIQSVWVGGNYLNLILEVEYHSVPHSLALLRDDSSSSIDLYISHSRNNDPAGYPQVMYASFLLTDLGKVSPTQPIPFRLFINTYSGLRVFDLEF